MNTHETASVASKTPVRFAPVPLLSGDVVPGADGPEEVVAVKVAVDLASGETVIVELECRFGGWWSPIDALMEN